MCALAQLTIAMASQAVCVWGDVVSGAGLARFELSMAQFRIGSNSAVQMICCFADIALREMASLSFVLQSEPLNGLGE